MFYAGIDLHKNYILITVINGGGFRISQIRINNDIQKIANFFAQFTEPVRIVIEATLNWYWIVELLDNLGYDIVLAHPKKLRAIVDAKLELLSFCCLMINVCNTFPCSKILFSRILNLRKQ
jgi:transposase